MNIIDISSWQQGLVLKNLFDKNPGLDGVIVKLSQGVSYINPCAKDWLSWLDQNNKPFGVYHYLDLYGAEAEAKHFVDAAKPYLGKAVLAIDYEANTLRKGTSYLKQCLDEIYKLTGVKPFVYISQSFIASQDFSQIVSEGYPLWMAQYADMNPVYGFKEDPWNNGSISPWDRFLIQQYTSCGRLEGWNHGLDFDKFYGTVEDWKDLSKGDSSFEPLKPADPSIVSEVLLGWYGNGENRVKKLLEDGYDPEAIQQKINELYLIARRIYPEVKGNIPYLNSIMKIVKGI